MAKLKYQLIIMQNNIYEIIDLATDQSVYQGDISECRAWIDLKEREYL